MRKQGETQLDVVAEKMEILAKVHSGRGPLRGWREIAFFLNMPVSTLQHARQELIEKRVIFYRRGRSHKLMVCAWPNDLREWEKGRFP
ncbi:MAG: hypothetical protein ACLP3B_22335 [Syntrophobacteraceae bacterium]